MEFHSQDYPAYEEADRCLSMQHRKLDLHGIRHEDVPDMVENFVLQYQEDMPLEIVYGNSPPMRSLVEQCLEGMGFSYNEGYQSPYGRLLVVGYREEA